MLLAPGFSFGQKEKIVINEVYPDPAGKESEEEWLELYNPQSQPLSLEGWVLKDLSSREYIFPNVTIEPRGYLVIARDKVGFLNLYELNPDLTDLNLTLNNAGEVLSLYDSTGALIDQIAWGKVDNSYSPAPKPREGLSLERQPAGFDSGNSQIDFIVQTEPTPGVGLFEGPQINEVGIDGSKAEVDWSWQEGLNNFYQFNVYLAKGGNDFKVHQSFDVLPDPLLTINDLDLATDYKLKLEIVKKKNDQKIVASSSVKHFSTSYDLSDEIMISEIYPAPKQDEEEYIELYNNSDRSVNLKGWYLADNVSYYRLQKPVTIKAKSFIVFENHQTSLRLNNDGDTAELYYPDHPPESSSPLDKVSYLSSKKGYSYSKNFKNDSFVWTSVPTPGSLNKFDKDSADQSSLKVATIKKALQRPIGSKVLIKGRVNVPPQVLAKQYLYLQDNSAGIQIYFHKYNWPKLKPGDLAAVRGVVSQSRGEKRVKISQRSDIERIKPGKISPMEVNFKNLHKHIGRLVEVKGAVSSSSGDDFYLEGVRGGEIRVSIKDQTEIKKPETRKGYQVKVAGVLTKTSSGLTVLPRFQKDLFVTPTASRKSEPAAVSPSPTSSKDVLRLNKVKNSQQANLTSSLIEVGEDYRFDLQTDQKRSSGFIWEIAPFSGILLIIVLISLYSPKIYYYQDTI